MLQVEGRTTKKKERTKEFLHSPPPPPPPLIMVEGRRVMVVVVMVVVLQVTITTAASSTFSTSPPSSPSISSSSTTVTTSISTSVSSAASTLGVCWRLKKRDGSCGRVVAEGISREDCCTHRYRIGWSPTSSAHAYTTHTAHAHGATIRPLNGTPVVTLDVARSEGTCAPCKTTCAGVRCGEDRKCVVRCGAPRCVCSPQCHLKHEEAVCGSDNRTYKSECHLLKRACRKKQRLSVAHYGPCQTCVGVRCSGGKKCVMDEQMTPRCVKCPSSCPRSERLRQLCGADQRTYSSPCHLKQASCMAGSEILRAYKGPCQEGATCNTVRCWRGQKCLTQEVSGQPQCTSCGALDSCLPSSRPVCASDGRVYPSWCAFKHEACRSGRALTPTLHLHCAANHTKPDDCHKQAFKLKKDKHRRKQMQLMKENEIRQQIQRQRVLEGVAQFAGTSNLQDLSLAQRLNSVERVGARGGTTAVRGFGRKKVAGVDDASTASDKRKKRKRRRRRRNCKKNRKRARQERQRSREKQKEEGD